MHGRLPAKRPAKAGKQLPGYASGRAISHVSPSVARRLYRRTRPSRSQNVNGKWQLFEQPPGDFEGSFLVARTEGNFGSVRDDRIRLAGGSHGFALQEAWRVGRYLLMGLLPVCRIRDLELPRGQNPTFCNSPDPRLLFRFSGLWCQGALHRCIHPQLRGATKRILSRLSFRQLLCLTGARVCLLIQMVRGQICDLLSAAHAQPHFGEYKLRSNQSRGSDCDGLNTTCI
jgi:hypothetical protein